MTSTTKANLAKTVEMPVVMLRQCRAHFTEIEVAVLCYLADAVTGQDEWAEATELRSSDLTETAELEAVQ